MSGRSTPYADTFADRDRELQQAGGNGQGRPQQRSEGEAYDEGTTLLISQRGATERLRVARKVFKGFVYVDVRVEFRPEGGARWQPTKRGLSIKTRELADVAAALQKAVDLVVEDAGGSR